jgi:tetratricopeptide (TPR) repeat protein
MRTLVLVLALALTAFGQRHKPEELDTQKPDGKALQEAMQEPDAAKKTALLEQFTKTFSKSDSLPWALEQLQALYVAADQPDKAIEAGEKLLAADPNDIEASLQTLKAAEAKKDPAVIVKWSASTSAMARKVMAAPKPEDETAENWKTETDFAKQVDGYTEFAIYKAAAESRDPKATIMLVESLEQRSPKSEYMIKAADPLFLAYRQSNAPEKAVALAERILAVEQTSEDMLLVVADSYLQKKVEPAKVHAYTAKVEELMARKSKPEGVADADWTARKSTITGLARYMDGKQYYDETQFAKADTELRAALPLLGSNAALKPEVLFLLGFANFKLEKAQEAADFYKACAALPSPYQATATKNLAGIKAKYRGVK